MQRVSGTERNFNRPLLVQIELSSIEQQIFSLLLEVNTSYRLGCTLRVAGGWVRDKLLGICADQIDLDIEANATSRGVGLP
jgi:tRNA nucleotidyltransferase/poly(A) polymerase